MQSCAYGYGAKTVRASLILAEIKVENCATLPPLISEYLTTSGSLAERMGKLQLLAPHIFLRVGRDLGLFVVAMC
jgi:hypothetical protein